MTTPAISVLSTLDDIPPLTFTTPESFFALPLAATPDERATLSETFVRELYSRGDDSLWTPAAPYYAALAERLAQTGLSYSAMGLFSTDDDGGVVQCAFTVAAVETDQSDPEIAAHGILTALAEDPYNDARWMDLPCGPAVSCVTFREVVLSPEITADGEQKKLLTGQIQVHVPFPTGPYTAVFTLHTASTEYWGEFCDMLVAVLRTVSFTDSEANSPQAASPEPEN
ncbi:MULTISPECIES: hypothetical protein [unclassified Streptomyces]|uniref:hypothetical protein n=1 Tax=unclassified Streptomyces TaxID=2593676 RepID=UPI002E805161|nr:hypothetical protein [Streptomyces sp. NBC_00589]WTI37099.1 hypothetical protein OIC96_19820 [Streptomyces sp. NBC_00775]WUB29225.1 hypothetical protein OHA51_29915 [Streptomyces sp. NBC_00589]